jgi:hypothetical protein
MKYLVSEPYVLLGQPSLLIPPPPPQPQKGKIRISVAKTCNKAPEFCLLLESKLHDSMTQQIMISDALTRTVWRSKDVISFYMICYGYCELYPSVRIQLRRQSVIIFVGN